MEKRANDGCTFCNFMRTSLLSEYGKLARNLKCKEEVVQVILHAHMVETVEDGSALAVYRNQEPNIIKVRMCIKDDDLTRILLAYDIIFQFSSGMCASVQRKSGKDSADPE